MAILIVGNHRTKEDWKKEFSVYDENLQLFHYKEDEIPIYDIEYAISWNHPQGYFNQFPNLKVVASLGAGVDHILRDSSLPENIKITRIVDQKLTHDMAEFVLMSCLNYARNTLTYADQSIHRKWEVIPYRSASETNVGIMGFGVLGKATAERLYLNDFKVRALVNTKIEHSSIEVFSNRELPEFLKKLDVLVCLLPLTHKTKGILSYSLFKKVGKPFYLINVARGAHLNEQDLIHAINKGMISGAHLDVFENEPLPKDHEFWEMPNIFISPHTASQTSPASVTKQLYENYQRMKSGQQLCNLVDVQQEY
jgi:glyoxylate/hydroxypyruvate reductase A